MERTSRTVQVTFDAHRPQALSRFWTAALGYRIPAPPGRTARDDDEAVAAWHDVLREAGVPESEWDSASAAEDPDGVGPRLYFQRVPEGKTAKNRVHLDVRAAPGLEGDERMAALETECARLVALGASRVERFEPAPPMGNGHIVMRDPEGNEFCLD